MILDIYDCTSYTFSCELQDIVDTLLRSVRCLIDTTTSAFQAQQGWHEAEDILELLQGSHATEVHFDGFSPKTINSLVKAQKNCWTKNPVEWVVMIYKIT